jgi:hypothetical protein
MGMKRCGCKRYEIITTESLTRKALSFVTGDVTNKSREQLSLSYKWNATGISYPQANSY